MKMKGGMGKDAEVKGKVVVSREEPGWTFFMGCHLVLGSHDGWRIVGVMGIQGQQLPIPSCRVRSPKNIKGSRQVLHTGEENL